MTRLQEKYNKQIVPAMQKEFGYTNVLAVPKMLKVTLNSGTGKALKDEKYLDTVVSNLTRISGQKPLSNRAKKSISAFKIREGMIVGVSVTLRGERMYDFVDKFINVALARVRDFQGVEPKNVDRNGNFTIGLKEHIVFPEIRSDEVERIHGLSVTITTNAKTNKEGFELFSLLGVPFKKQ
jgi:large subunit ribosomal protein L5